VSVPVSVDFSLFHTDAHLVMMRFPFHFTKRPGCEIYPSPSSFKVKNAWHCISAAPYVLVVWCLTDYRDIFIFLGLLKAMNKVFIQTISVRQSLRRIYIFKDSA
jgi:hypothetical protein